MSEPLDWNAKTIAEFRANQGRVGGNFEGAPMVLVHHRGRKSGREYVTPMMYLPHETEPDSIYVFATKAGAPTNPASLQSKSRPWPPARRYMQARRARDGFVLKTPRRILRCVMTYRRRSTTQVDGRWVKGGWMHTPIFWTHLPTGGGVPAANHSQRVTASTA